LPEDIRWAKPLLRASGRQGCENGFAGLYAWANANQTKIARYKGFFVSCFQDSNDDCAFGFPVGEGDPRGIVQDVLDETERRGVPFRMWGLTESECRRLDALFPARFRFEIVREDADYIYNYTDLAFLPGKKYHQKRNHIAKFKKERNWTYEPLTANALGDCFAMVTQWEKSNEARDSDGLRRELDALERVFACYEQFGCIGGLLRVDGNVVAFTLGEALNENLFCTHFEKAFAAMPGAYQMINQTFAQESLAGFSQINREEDIGDEGLRKAKLSYYPSLLLTKYNVFLAGN
jgi:hypothetical protein